MPELPEVENLRLGLLRTVVGQKVRRVDILAPKMVSGKGNLRKDNPARTCAFARGLSGEKIISIERRAKNLIFKFSHDKVLLVHLKMTGQLVYVPTSGGGRGKKKNRVMGGHPIELSEHELPHKHTRVIFRLSNGTLFYNDTRMFGYLLFYKNQRAFEKENHFIHLGLEPQDRAFTLKYFEKSLRNRSGNLKKVFMDQGVVTGLGNIYADEVAFEAGVRPTKRASLLRTKEVKKLYAAIKRILPAAIKEGGSSVANYLLSDGSRGNYARYHKVYGKGGEPCFKCEKPLVKTKLHGRTTVFCQKCQK